MQMRRSVFDVIVLVLAGPTFGGDDAAAVDVLEIPEGELIMPFGLLAFLVIYPQYHLPYSANPFCRINSFSCCADGRCSLHASRSSNTNLPSLISLLASSTASSVSSKISTL